MGAHEFQQVAFGKDAQDAYRRACDEADDYAGHQEGYNGTISTTSGISLIHPPTAGMSMAVFAQLPGWVLRTERVEASDFPTKAALAKFKRAEKEYGNVLFTDYAGYMYVMPKEVPARYREYVSKQIGKLGKWADAGCIELTGTAGRKAKAARPHDARRGDRVFIFFGWAAS